ncbi:hypothetical protein DPMN_062160 [Dreissena polymorpha]|uniref:Uncharacterized protein n=1 Tax=Dreissena polymorpha TaxID=45954 RepID=A0A9D4HJ43_DREPO|nr:hypothetical protein DPMN_062160 [Dreissena polymorpha]
MTSIGLKSPKGDMNRLLVTPGRLVGHFRSTILATFMDPAVTFLTGLHVTPAGQVLVCGRDSKNIIQVDSKGSMKLATLATQRDGVKSPISVCYNRLTDSIIVGQRDHKKILVYKVK